MKVIFTIGISASGKSTWAEEETARLIKSGISVVIVCRDNIRHTIASRRLFNKGYQSGYKSTQTNLWKVWNWKWEKEVTDIWWDKIEYEVSRGTEVIICADTNLNRGRLDEIKNRMIRDYHITDFEEKMFDISIEDAWKRDAARPDGVGHDVVWKQYKQLQEMKGKTYVSDKSLPKAVIFDIDGTLADHTGVRGPFDWDKVDQDKVRTEIVTMFNGLKDAGYKMIIVSGRDGSCFIKTDKWLTENEIFYDKFFMRNEGDMRKDVFVKEEIFDKFIRDNYNVCMVVDDRPQVVRYWLSIGLPVAVVGDPYCEF